MPLFVLLIINIIVMQQRVIDIDKEIMGGTPVFLEPGSLSKIYLIIWKRAIQLKLS